MDEDDVIMIRKRDQVIPKQIHSEDFVECECGLQVRRKRLPAHKKCRLHQQYEILKEKFIKGELGY